MTISALKSSQLFLDATLVNEEGMYSQTIEGT
jgi:hypothetical protein